MKEYLKEIKERVAAISGTIPSQRKLSKKGYSFSGLSLNDQLAIWDHAWKNSDGRVKLHAFFYIERFSNKPAILVANKDILVGWQDHVDDWSYCDGLAKIYTKLLEEQPAEMYSLFREWNKDTNLWKRRQSIVSLLYYARTKRKFLLFEQIASLIENLLDDEEYYVQKGVGWAIRELYNVYPKEAFGFMKKNIKRISAIAFTAAIEKLDAVQKGELKNLRKK